MAPHFEEFGFLNFSNVLEFEGGRIEPLESFSESFEYVQDATHADGYCYPPISHTYALNAKTLSPLEKMPNTERPASVFSLPSSHRLVIDNPTEGENMRRADAGLLLHLIALMFGTRLQFAGWGFDGKVPIKSTHSVSISNAAASDFISHVYRKWRSWNKQQKTTFINIAYMKQRAHSSEWEWDIFLHQYLVMDAIYRFHIGLGHPEARRHGERVSALCSHYSIPHDAKRIEAIVKLRNQLIHEALWDGETPGLGGIRSFHDHIWLGNLNFRLLLGVASYPNRFSRSNWWTFGTRVFDRLENKSTEAM